MSKRVVIAMSGGVDSSVAAYILKRDGFDPIGITMQVYDHSDEKSKFGSCCGTSDIEDARRVADKIGIPYYLLDFEDVFKTEVIDNFVSEYLKGRTPIPCIHCNSKVKFKHLYDKAKELGADYVATGHYARIEQDASGIFHLKKAVDLNKDQTYFLFELTQAQLSHTLFPLGSITKPEVREIARELGLVTAEKRESQGICFVPDRDYAKYVEGVNPKVRESAGEIVSTDGTVIGRHDGIYNFTVGQRHGLGVAVGEPLFVKHIDPISKRVIVGRENELLFSGLEARGVNWIIDPSEIEGELCCRARYRTEDASCDLKSIEPGRFTVQFKSPVRAVAPGQAAVLYRGSEVIGGGWIEEGICFAGSD